MRLTAALQLVRTAQRAPLCDASDAELLRRFGRDRDETAFRELLLRYEGLVRAASRRLTRDRHAVDDAVQSTFLALAREAHAIRHPEALPAWLYRVARSVTARAAQVAPPGAERVDPARSALDQLLAREVVAIFDEELARLPAAHRSAVLLCAVEGNTVEDAARRLETSPGAVRGWLQRGRDRLRQRLGRRGVDLSVATSLLALDPVPGAAGPGVTRSSGRRWRPTAPGRHPPSGRFVRHLGGGTGRAGRRDRLVGRAASVRGRRPAAGPEDGRDARGESRRASDARRPP